MREPLARPSVGFGYSSSASAVTAPSGSDMLVGSTMSEPDMSSGLGGVPIGRFSLLDSLDSRDMTFSDGMRSAYTAFLMGSFLAYTGSGSGTRGSPLSS